MDFQLKLGEQPCVRCPGASARYRNLRADDFPMVFEHDIPLLLDECGGPVINLEGKAIGVTIVFFKVAFATITLAFSISIKWRSILV